MARVMPVIRKIVDRRAYNRANIVNLISALTYRASHFSFLARSFAITFPLSSLAIQLSASPFSIRRSEENFTRKLHFPQQRLRLKPASSSLVIVLVLYSVPRDPQRTPFRREPTLKSAKSSNFRIFQGRHNRCLSLKKYKSIKIYEMFDFIVLR